jgi:hypothetical protein
MKMSGFFAIPLPTYRVGVSTMSKLLGLEGNNGDKTLKESGMITK